MYILFSKKSAAKAAPSQKALQRYSFLRTQQNKMHKNGKNVHISADLCNTIKPFSLRKVQSYSVTAKKETSFFVLLSTFRNFERFLSFSLYKGGLGD